MSDKAKRTNPVLILLCVLLSCTCAWALTESTSAPYISEKTESADVILAKDPQEGDGAETESPQIAEENPDTAVAGQTAEENPETAAAGQTAEENPASEDDGQTTGENTDQAAAGNTDAAGTAEGNAVPDSEDTAASALSENTAASASSEDAAGSASSEKPAESAPDETGEAAAVTAPDLDPGPIRQPSPYDVSPEAQNGYWTSWGTGWMFMVDGAAYHGWLNDTDGKRYYLNDEGVMATGWLKEDGATYYLDEDGIMQTGLVTIDGKDYNFDPTGKCTDCQ